MPDILVLPPGVHGQPIEDYANELETTLPEQEITVARTTATRRELLAGAEIVSGGVLSEEDLAYAPDLEWFACLYSGTNHLPLDALADRDVIVTNASGVHGPIIAEYVVGSILAMVHRFDRGQRRQRRNEWRAYGSQELAGDTVTIVGLGAIGKATVERLAGFDVTTIGIRHSPEKGAPTDRVYGYDQDAFEAALARTDHLVLACPLTDTTRGLIGRDELLTLPPSATVTNVARGAVVDTDALVYALQRKHIQAATLDVSDPEPLPGDHPLWDIETVRITPHVAGETPMYYQRRAALLATNLRRLTAGQDLENTVRA